MHKQTEITKCLARNAYCKDMSKMVFITTDTPDEEDTSPCSNFDHFKAKQLDRSEDGSLLEATDDTLANKVKEMNGSIRCLELSPDGTQLASGDQLGHVRVHDLESSHSGTGDIEEVKSVHAHDNEVICLSYSPSLQPSTHRSLGSSIPMTKERYWLASGSRDKLVHVFDSENNYEAVSVLDHHTSTITALKFN
jgi:WD40 repeat protein